MFYLLEYVSLSISFYFTFSSSILSITTSTSKREVPNFLTPFLFSVFYDKLPSKLVHLSIQMPLSSLNSNNLLLGIASELHDVDDMQLWQLALIAF